MRLECQHHKHNNKTEVNKQIKTSLRARENDRDLARQVQRGQRKSRFTVASGAPPTPRAKVKKKSLRTNTGCNLIKKQRAPGRARENKSFKSKESRRAKSRPSARPRVFFSSQGGSGGGRELHSTGGSPNGPGRPAEETHLGQVSLRHGWCVSRAAAAPLHDAPIAAARRRHPPKLLHTTHTAQHSRRDALSFVIHSPPLALDYLRPEKRRRRSRLGQLPVPAAGRRRRANRAPPRAPSRLSLR